MKIVLHRDPSVFDLLAPEWDALLSSATTNVVFLTREWQSAWWRCMHPGDLLVITVRDDADRLQAIVPLFRRKSNDGLLRLSIVGCEDVSDYLDFIVLPDNQETICRDVLSFLTSAEFPSWDRLEFCNAPATSAVNRAFYAAAEQANLPVQRRQQEVCPVIGLPHTWDEYLATLDKKQRHELRRKIRRAEAEAKTEWYVVDPNQHDLAAEMESFFELHRLSSPEKSIFMDGQMRAFFSDVAQSLAGRGWLHLSFITMNAQRAAGMLCFEYNNAFEVYNSGYDPNSYAQLSPGIVLMAYCIQQAIERGHSVFDFLRGEEEYKFRFGAKPTGIYEVSIARDGSGSMQ
jgi:CelD/BcsL family acetyltransferase involved in cellulose biosynthesis